MTRFYVVHVATVWNARMQFLSHAMYGTSKLSPETLSLTERLSFHHWDFKATRKYLSLGFSIQSVESGYYHLAIATHEQYFPLWKFYR